MNEERKTETITKARRVKLAKVSGGQLDKLPLITHIAVGDGGVDADKLPLTPNEGQTALNHEVGRYPVTLSFPDETTLRYQIVIPEEELTGYELSEMALIDSDGDLTAIKNMYIKKKDSYVKFTFEFDNQF